MNISEDYIPEKIADNIYLTDTLYLGREKFAASYFIEDGGEIAIVETNTNHAIPGILNAILNSGFKLSQIKYVVLTHIHLDHAGGAGLIMKELPDAELIVHPRGARHMISPEKLIESVKSVYGEEEYKNLYGDIIGIPEGKVISLTGGESISIGKRKLTMIDAPGHAKHHNIIYDESSGSVFSGDAFGIGYPRFRYGKGDLIFPSTSPVQFDPESAIQTYKMITDLNPARILLTHFGSVENIEEIHTQLLEWIDYTAEYSSKRFSEGYRMDKLSEKLSEDIWGKFSERSVLLTGKSLSDEERDFLFLDADLNGKGASFYISQKNLR
ncbi:MAG: MBL fold metallo-hydrolase [Candidatus Aminicenantes bacterium]|nr:MBL fold metallo-hydrolase [Candidatus Aminicenantes bacterium]